MPVMTAPELIDLMNRVFPQSRADQFQIEAIEDRRLVVRYRATTEDLRPGETVSGPVLMAVADLAMYLTVLSAIGPVPLAVTTNLNINFLRKPSAGELVAEARLLKLGKQLAVGEVYIRSEGESEIVAHATVTYSIPPGTPSVVEIA